MLVIGGIETNAGLQVPGCGVGGNEKLIKHVMSRRELDKMIR